MSDQNNYKIGIEIQQKFIFYFLALTFTILGLSIQTAKTGSYFTADILEISSWFLLFVSGMVGLWRIEWMPNFYFLSGKKIDQEKLLNEFKIRYPRMTSTIIIAETQEEIPVETFFENRKKSIENIKSEIEKIDSWMKVKYNIQKVSFLVGFVSLILSRSYSILYKLFVLK